ncbi:Ig-like domain-containing protein [Aeromonas hydrophila]|nr:Ig-like domain-containing protein [Aeromonas hydrophila]MBS4670275.1 Ig-like domain-containing protein [Aeromonas hydrophila]SUU21507.1 intimin/invasin family protein [Aeromonas hydrophila]HEG4446282.1 Ig-like domain-containing protein [Aeromonas hydrophila]
MKVISRYLSYLALWMVLWQTTGAMAESANTLSVQGRAPVASGVTLTGPAAPLVGDTLLGTYTFNDLDADEEEGSVLRWLNNSDIELARGDRYLLTDAERGKQLRFAVTPATNPAVTDPHEGAEVSSSLSAVVQGRPDPAKSTFSANKSTIVADGVDNAVLTLTLKDDNQAPVTGISDRVALGYSGVDTDVISLTENDLGNGIYEYILTGTKSGVVTLTPQLDGAPLTTIPQSLQVTLAANPATTKVVQLVTTTDSQPADNVSADLLTATVHDIEGNPMQGASVVWSHGSTTATLGAATSVTDSNGLATVSLINTRAETVAVTARVQANSGDSGMTSDANFALYPVLDTLAVGTNNQPANNKALNTIVATFKDLDGAVLANVPITVQFTADKSTVTFDNESPWTTTTNDAGAVIVSLRNNVVENVEVTLYATNSSTVQKVASVNFTELMISRFLKPDPATMNWLDADNYCNNIGRRLPTVDELRALFVEVSPSFGQNYELCYVHGWPMDGKCGGTYDDYWTSEKYVPHGTSAHAAVYMHTGAVGGFGDTQPSQVVCIRR